MQLRKRKVVTESDGSAAPPKKQRAGKDAKDTTTKKTKTSQKSDLTARVGQKPVVGNSIELDGFGGELQIQDGIAVTLKSILSDSKSGVILFVYPRASTPGCKLFIFFLLFFSALHNETSQLGKY